MKDWEWDVELIWSGSWIKICVVGEGKGDVYGGFGGRMEWDRGGGDGIGGGGGMEVYEGGKEEGVE